MITNAELSRMLWDAREQLDMWADVIEIESPKPATHVRNLVDQIDSYRAARGWSPNGFGGEQ